MFLYSFTNGNISAKLSQLVIESTCEASLCYPKITAQTKDDQIIQTFIQEPSTSS